VTRCLLGSDDVLGRKSLDRDLGYDAGSIHNHPIVHGSTPIKLHSSLCLSNPNDLDEESKVDTGNTSKSKNSVSGSVDALDSETYSSAPAPIMLRTD
jgi:hypothetical protein